LGFKFKELARYLCIYFRVTDVWKIDPRQGRVEAWTLMIEGAGQGAAVGIKPRTLAVEVGSVLQMDAKSIETFKFAIDGDPLQQVVRCPLVNNTPRCRFLSPPRGDLEHVCLLNVVTRNVWCSTPVSMAARFPFYPVGDKGKREALDKLQLEGGAVPGPYMQFGATPKDGADVDKVPVEESLVHGFLNRFYVATMALVNDSNLRNGVVPIPYAECLAAGLPVFKGPPPPPSDYEGDVETWNRNWLEHTAKEHRIQCFYAIPVNHVLAWGLRNEAYATRRKLPSLRFQFIPPAHAGMGSNPVLLYFLVADLHFDFLVREVQQYWIGNVDVRPLASLSFELYPVCARSANPNVPANIDTVGGVAALRSYLTYLAPDVGAVKPEEIPNLIPTLCPGFPEPDGWVPYTRDEMTLIEHAAGGGGGGGGGGSLRSEVGMQKRK